MALETECVHCRTHYTLKDRALEGKKIRCKNCGKPFTVKRVESFDEIEDYDDDEFSAVDDGPSSGAPTVAGNPAKPKKKRKKKSGSAAAWKTPAIIGASVIAACLGLWGLIQILPGGMFSIFDSHESLVDDRIALMYDYVDAMEDLSVHQDGQMYQAEMFELMRESDKIQERFLNLGAVDDKRIREVREYIRERQKDVIEDLKQRREAAEAKLEKLEPGGGAAVSLAGGSISKFDFDWFLVEELPEPQAGEEPDRELVRTGRDAIRTLLRVSSSSDPGSSLSELQDLTAKFESMRETMGSQRGLRERRRTNVASPYFSLKLKTGVHLGILISRVRARVADNPEVFEQLNKLGQAIALVEH